MYEQIIPNTVYGPNGETFKVTITMPKTGGTLHYWYWTQREAMEARDRAFDEGFSQVRVDGLPTIIAGCMDVGHLPLIDIRDDE